MNTDSASSRLASAAPTHECDVLVVGGGPAGSTVAPLLAQKGYRVAVLEKAHHPRFHIGESLLPANLPLLDELGVGDAVREMGMPKFGAEFVSPWHEPGSQTYEFAGAWDKSMPSAYQVLRSEFDEILIRNALAKGASIIEGCKALSADFEREKNAVWVQARHDDGRLQEWRARFLVDASGRDTLLANQFKIKRSNKKHNSTALYAHFKGAERHSGQAEGHITIFWFDYGWFWFIPLRDGLTSIGMVTWPHFLKTRGARSLDAFFMDGVRMCPKLQMRLAQAEKVSDVVATGNFSYISERNHGSNYVMLGDAYAFIDPVFSSGVWLAMKSGAQAAQTIHTCLSEPAQAAHALAEFDRVMRHGPREFSWFIYRVTNPSMRDMFMEPSEKFQMKEALLSMLAGDIYGQTPIWRSLRVLKGAYYLVSLLNFKRSWMAWKKRKKDIIAVPGLLPQQTEY